MTSTPSPNDRFHHEGATEVFIPVAEAVVLRALVREPATDVAVDAPLLLLIHGLASNARMWDGVGAELARRGYRSIAVDLRGHGRSSKPDDGYDFATICADLCALLDHLGEPDAVFVGQSWGGNVVVHAGHAHPDRVVGVVAVDGGMIELQHRFPDWDDCAVALRPPTFTGLAASRFEASVRSMNRDWPETGIIGSLSNFEVLPDATVRAWLAHHGQVDAAANELGVHRHTVRHRLRRAETLLERSFEDPAVRADLWFALRSVEGQ
jgi:pimeloyl-ACP methyl ester carboxylesterase